MTTAKLALATAFTLVATVATGTELRIHLERPKARELPVMVDRAELLLVAWGDTERIQLRPDIEAGELGFFVSLCMGLGAAHWGRNKGMDGRYIFLRRTTHAPIP